jgi:hypothetical protein
MKSCSMTLRSDQINVMRCHAEVSMIVRTMELQATTGHRI